MRFNEFLITPIDGKTPVQKIKEDLSYFEGVFNYASKAQGLYDNLIDNVVFILQSKYGRFDILYYNAETMYKELMLILSPQIPQFLMIQKKQLLESLDTFSSLQNWGQIDTDTVKRTLNITGTSTNDTNYIPLDGADKDPYSSNDIKNTEERLDDTLANRNVVDFLDFYRRINWNVADLELNKILEPYRKLFKMYYSSSIVQQSVPESLLLEKRVETLEQKMAVTIDELDVAQDDILTNKTNITANENNISQNTRDIESLQREVITIDSNVDTLIATTNEHTRQINTNIANIATLDVRSDNNSRNIATNTAEILALHGTTNTLQININKNADDIADLTTTVANKANTADVYLKNQVYSKTESDNTFIKKVKTYTSGEISADSLSKYSKGVIYYCGSITVPTQGLIIGCEYQYVIGGAEWTYDVSITWRQKFLNTGNSRLLFQIGDMDGLSVKPVSRFKFRVFYIDL